MSETNNNIPMRITQLEEATAYEEGMYYAVAKAGSGTFKMNCDTKTPQVAALKDQVNYAVEKSTAWNSYDIDSTSFFTKISGKNANVDTISIFLSSLGAYNSYSWEIQKPTKVYFDSNHISSYTAICYGNNYTEFENDKFLCSNAVRKRTSDSNLPTTEENAITLNVGDIVVITVLDGESSTIKIYETEYNFTDELSDFIAEETAETKNAVDAMIEEGTITNKISVATSSLFTKYSNYYANVSGAGIDLYSGYYDSYSWEITSPIKVYFDDPSDKYISICYGDNYSGISGTRFACSNAVRKRTSDSNLPTTAETAISLNVGDIVVITVPFSDTIGLNLISDGYLFTDEAKEQIKDISSQEVQKKPLVVYDSTQISYDSERLYIYIPCKSGYIKYNFAHTESTSINADCWLIHPLFVVDDSLSELYQLTLSGEFECAIRISGAPDFMGGSSHGSEVLTYVKFLIDGKAVNPSTLTTLTEFEELRIIEQSNLYDPRDEETLVAIHGKEYVFTKDKLVLNQSVLWQHNEELVNSYLTMFPIIKANTEYITQNKNYNLHEFSDGSNFEIADVSSSIVWKDSIGLSVKISTPMWDIEGQNLTKVRNFAIQDNGGINYNKQYFYCCESGNVSSGDLWRTTTEFEFDINS